MIRGSRSIRRDHFVPVLLLGWSLLQLGVTDLNAQDTLGTGGSDTGDTDLRFNTNDKWSKGGGGSFRLPPPDDYNTEFDYDPNSGQYQLQPKLGDSAIGPSQPMSLEEYMEQDMKESIDEYWQEKKEAQRLNRRDPGFKPSLEVPAGFMDRIFGGDQIEIQPQGSAELTFGVNTSKTENPQIPENQRKITTFDFDQQIQLNVTGSIGDKLELRTNYNTESQFDFQNQMKLEYTGYEDEIIKKIEAGNVSLPVNSSLISGSQSLFGVKTKLQFGRLKITSVFSQQKGDKKEIEVKGGAQTQEFKFKADEYERNQHYFLSHYFRDNYNEAMESLPQVNSGVNITRVEVWVTNKNNNTQNTRNIVTFSDLGESEGPDPNDPNYHTGMGIVDSLSGHLPANQQNNIYGKVSDNSNVRGFYNANSALGQMSDPGPFDPVEDYETVANARKLSESEYKVNKRLGFISLKRSLNQDEVLGVAFEYTYQGETYQVGEFSTDGSSGEEALILKMLKSTNTNPREKIWDLMMKNVYSIDAYQMSRKNFDLQILYNDPQQGVNINYIPQGPIDGEPLIQVLRCDRLNQNNRRFSDGVFDFVDNAATQGGTVESSSGKIYFPVLEPFGDHLRKVLQQGGVQQSVIDNIAYDPLYDSTVTAARQIPQLNRFTVEGSYESNVGSTINLNAMNIPEGSVKVTAGGVKLEEGTDYTVDYTLGRVKILNEGLLRSQTKINVSLESNSGFNVQTKRLMGSRFDYRVSEDLNLGATVLNLTERPLTQKVNIGNEPISNTMVGADMSYQTESQFLTKMVDKIPGIDTKAKSSIDLNAEYARLIPGHAKAIGKEGNSYIDDFEGSQSSIDLRSISRWQLASTPQGQPSLFPEGSVNNNRKFNYNRGNLAWYVIDPLFFRNNNLTPNHIANNTDMRSDHRMREVLEQEVFPNKELPQGTPPNIAVLDLAYYPSERGQYNYETSGSNVSEGLNPDGSLDEPESRWGGIMRKLQTTDFEQSNIEYIQFWLMDPFNEDSDNNSGGDLYFNLGNISEDVLKDNRKSFENGLPTAQNPDPNQIDTSAWGLVPTTQSIVNAFSNDPSDRKFQDIGLDGLDSEQERDFFNDYLTQVQSVVTDQQAYQEIEDDPSADDYNYYRDDDYDQQKRNILERYKEYNGLDGNSPTTEQSEQINDDGYPTSATTRPDAEDIDLDNNMNTTESYFQYKVSLRPQDLEVGENYITDKRVAYPDVPNGNNKQVTWYQFKIPVRDFTKRVNNIRNFRSIRFMRIFMKNWEEKVVLRFARLELIRGDWRRYTDLDLAEGEYVQDDPPETNFNIGAVNIEENADRNPIPYVLPPGITRETNNQSTNLSKLNEQSLTMEVCNLQDGDSRAAYRNLEMDIRRYKRIKMFAHLESPEQNVDNEDVTLFIRFGTDFKRNYYEYEIPLKPTAHDATTPNEIWPKENRIDLKLSLLKLAKKKRNARVSQGQITYNEVFTMIRDGARISVVGTPNLADMKTVMIGVRNPGSQKDHPWEPDDGRSKCFEVWVNELRLNQFKNEGGWAATATMNAQLADLGNVSVSGNMSTPGFGSLDDKINDRQFETRKSFNASSNISLSKFFGKNAKINLPLYLGYSEGVEEPKYDPLNPDLLFDSSLARLEKPERQKRRHQAVTYRKTRSLNLTNVSYTGGSGDPKIYSPSNLSLSYSYNESFMRDVNTLYNTQKRYNGNLNYSYSPSPPTVEPLSDVDFLGNSDWLDLIESFNFQPYPNSISITNNVTRNYTERQTRSNTDAITIPQANKEFDWTRSYNFRWSLTKNLEIDYQANTQAIIGEPPGQIDSKRPNDSNRYGIDYGKWKDTVKGNIKKLGENTTFQQSINGSYQLPLDKIPATDWVQVTTQYNATFDWQRAPFSQDSLGNTIQNSRKIQVNGNLDMTRLYDKVGYLKKVRQKFQGGGRRNRNTGKRNSMEGRGEGDDGDGEEDSGPSVLDHTLNFLMSLEKISVTYSRNEGTRLPGYGEKAKYAGMDQDLNAPGYKFLVGHQDPDFKHRASRRGWLVQQENLNQEYRRNNSEQFNLRATLRPANRLRIQINASRQESWDRNSFFRWDDSLQTHVEQSPQRTGDLSMSILTWRTTFIGTKDDGSSPTFEQFKKNRKAYSEQYGNDHSNSSKTGNGYYDGYSGTQQNVVTSSFLAAYMGQKPKNVEKNPFNMLPKPNWSINYDGLSQIDLFKDVMKNFSLSHSYRSRMSTSYQTPLQYDANDQGDPIARNQKEDFIPKRRMQTMTISESFSPLIGMDITWDNDMVTKFEIKKSRNLSLSLTNYQVNEVRSQEYTFGAGYSFKDVVLPFEVLGNELKSDLKLRADVSIRDNKTYIRKMVEEQDEITSGQRVISIKTNADYTISRRLNIRFFYDRTVNEPYVSNTYPTTNTKVGLTLRLTLAQ